MRSQRSICSMDSQAHPQSIPQSLVTWYRLKASITHQYWQKHKNHPAKPIQYKWIAVDGRGHRSELILSRFTHSNSERFFLTHFRMNVIKRSDKNSTIWRLPFTKGNHITRIHTYHLHSNTMYQKKTCRCELRYEDVLAAGTCAEIQAGYCIFFRSAQPPTW